MKKKLVLGMAMNYDWDALRNFIHSLRQTGYGGAIVLFVSPDIDQRTQDNLIRNSVEFIRLDGSSPYLAGLPSETYEDPAFLDKLPPSVYRILVFYNYLLSTEHIYSDVLFTDVRDVVFQLEPFSFAYDEKLCFFIESRTLLLKDADWNALWIIAAFGVQVLYEIGDNLGSCIGTVYGPVSRMIDYLGLLLKYLKNVQIVMMFGIEQAVHNYVIVKNEVQDYVLFYTEEGPVATISTWKDIRRNEQGLLINRDSSIPNVVHQYDRHPDLKDFYDMKYQ